MDLLRGPCFPQILPCPGPLMVELAASSQEVARSLSAGCVKSWNAAGWAAITLGGTLSSVAWLGCVKWFKEGFCGQGRGELGAEELRIA